MKRLLIVLVSAIFFLAGCGETTVTRSSFLMDTVITYNLTNPEADKIVDECDKIISANEALLSAHISESLVLEFNENGTALLTNVAFFDNYRIAASVYAQTDGAFDITVSPLVTLWDVAHPGDDWTPPSDTDITSLLSHVGMDKLDSGLSYLARLDDQTKIDLGGIAKGYTLGAVLEYIESTYPKAYGTVSFGGNIALVANKSDGSPWKVGVKDPFDTSRIIGILSLDAGIVSVSGSYERYVDYNGTRYHHIIDPATGSPVQSDLVSVSVWIDTSDPFCDKKNAGAYADALSTALFVMGHDAALLHYEKVNAGEVIEGAIDNLKFEAVLIKSDGTVTVTDGLAERYTPNE